MINKYLSNAEAVLKNYAGLIDNIREKKDLNSIIIGNSLIIILFSIIYGAVLGIFVWSVYGNPNWIGVNAVKMPLLLMVTFLISIPIFYIIDTLLGNKIELMQTIALVSVGFVSTSVILIAFTPVILFFIITSPEYNFISFLNVGICGLAGYIGLTFLIKSYRNFHRNESWYYSVIVGCFVIAFVGTQLSWTLRPFLHTYDTFIRPIERNFYLAMVEFAGNNPNIAVISLFVFILIALILTYMQSPKTEEKKEKKEEKKEERGYYPFNPYAYYNPYNIPQQQVSQPQIPKEEKKEEKKEEVEDEI